MVNFGHFLSRYPLELIVINILWAAVALISVLPKKRIHRNEWLRMQRRLIFFFLLSGVPLAFLSIESLRYLGINGEVRAYMFLVLFISIVISPIIKEWEIRFLRPKMDSLLRSPGIIEAFLAACLIQFAVVLTLVTLATIWVFGEKFVFMQFHRVLIFSGIGLTMFWFFSLIVLMFRHYFLEE